mgnify:CR=1 FL=1
MTESQYQNKIAEELVEYGGVAINGIYTKKGEADLQCGISWDNHFLHLAIEVKTKKNYIHLMKGITISDGLYEIIDYKYITPREKTQIYKINRNRELGGRALLAYEFNQVLAYMNGEEDIYATS